ncbi:MAG: S9 family peptidase [Bacteroidetes bacterium]|nr:MAG: S9 family peptidase [Bacteroidota bacterium]
MKNIILLAFTAIILLPASRLSAQISVEDIYASSRFFENSVSSFNFMKDGKHYTRLENNKIVKFDLTTGHPVETIFDPENIPENTNFNGRIDDYTFSRDESKILITSETERIYRHSTRARAFVWDLRSRTLLPVFTEAKVRLATFNPNGDKVAFVIANNLYYKDFRTGETTIITEDGKWNEIINGGTDWVYEEEFGFDKGFEWSPDGKKIAFYRFDEREVPQFTLTNYHDDIYPEYVTYKYPKVGEKNSKVTIHIYHLDSKKTRMVSIANPMEYIPRIKWTQDPNTLCVFNMNRHQNKLELLLADAQTGDSRVLLTEENKWYIDIHDNLIFLKNGKEFLWTSEKDGWNHIYLYNMNGDLVRQITKGPWEVTAFYGFDEKRGLLFYQAAKESPLRREIYQSGLKGKMRKLSTQAGWNSAQFSRTFDYYVLNFSTHNIPPVYTVFEQNGRKVRIIEDNSRIRQVQQEAGVSPVEFFTFQTSQGTSLNGYLIKPANFDPARQYPVLMYQYSGPGSQQVVDQWQGRRYYWWLQMLAQKGFLVACVDGRGTGGRGEAFKKMTYLELGKMETEDQIEAAKYLGALSYTDANRIGIFGWSYGGYMSSLCILKGNDVFKAAIAVAPVTSWKWYDTIYTERYMRTLQENESGYRDNSPIYFADRLKGNYLIIHGMGDDNVHFQNTAEMVNALIAANKQFDTYFYPNRNHGIYGGVTRLHLFTKMTRFLEEKLKNDTRPVGKD